MRLRVKIDDELLANAKRVTGVTSTRVLVEQALELLARIGRQDVSQRSRDR